MRLDFSESAAQSTFVSVSSRQQALTDTDQLTVQSAELDILTRRTEVLSPTKGKQADNHWAAAQTPPRSNPLAAESYHPPLCSPAAAMAQDGAYARSASFKAPITISY